MALKKKDDGWNALKTEAEENGINLSKAEDGTFTAAVAGGHTLDGYADARACLDDMLAVIEMDERDDVYTYDNADEGGYKVEVIGGEGFVGDTLAAAFALAKESVITREQAAKAPKKSAPKVVETIPEERTEILQAAKPNGAEKVLDRFEQLAQGLLDIASTLTSVATALRSPTATIPFVQKGFEEGEPEAAPAPTPARSRVTRERRK